MTGPETPDDIDDLGESLRARLRDVDSVDVQIALTENTTIELDE